MIRSMQSDVHTDRDSNAQTVRDRASLGWGLYIHTPFCETKCGYCDFYSVALKGRSTGPLVDAILRELDLRLLHKAAEASPATEFAPTAAAASRRRTTLPIRTVFIGGGTPTLLPFDDLARLLRRVNDLLPVAQQAGLPDCAGASGCVEFTVEANPATVDEGKARLLVESGVTRVSMGAQSFLPAELTALERLHSPEDVAPSAEVLRRAGIGQINIDLIFGIPGQTIDSWLFSLRRAIELAPDHIACYGLTYEPGTRLTAQRDAGRVMPCEEEPEAEMFERTIDVLAAAGYEQYEISNFARPGCECRHNLIYWRNLPYVGIGPSAAGCYPGPELVALMQSAGGDQGRLIGADPADLRQPNGAPPPPFSMAAEAGPAGPGGWPLHRSAVGGDRAMRRYKNVPDIARYTRMMTDTGCAEIESEVIEGQTLAHEMILMQLRLNEGMSISDFRARTGRDPLRCFEDVLPRLIADDLLYFRDADGLQGEGRTEPIHIALTVRGRLVANRVMADLAAGLGW